MNLAVTNLDKRLTSMYNDFKVLHQKITQKFLQLTAQLNSAYHLHRQASKYWPQMQIMMLSVNYRILHHVFSSISLTLRLYESVVTQVIEELRKEDSLSSTIVVYGFPNDHNNNYPELVCMFNFLQCHCEIVCYSRLGLSKKSSRSSRGRPIRVQLKPSRDVNSVFFNAKYLRDDKYNSNVRICKWLSADKLLNVKSIRQKCDALNKASAVDKNERRPFCVLSIKITKRITDRKLTQIDDNDVKPSPSKPPKAPVSGTASNKILHSPSSQSKN